MWDIEILFIAYNISRCHKEGRTIRDSINAKLQMIASFNGYKEDFNSFSDIVDWHNFVHSPLNNLVRSGGFIVTDADTPFPYSVTEFLELLSRTSFFTGLIVLNYPEEDTLRLPEIKYRILKKGTEFEFAAPQPKPETNDPGVFFDRSVDLTASVCKKDLSEFIARLPTRFKEQTFGGTGGVCGLRFCSTFGEAIDQLLEENLGVYILPNIQDSGAPLISIWCYDSYRSSVDYEVSYALEARYKGDLMKLQYRSVMVTEDLDPDRADMQGPNGFFRTPYVTLRDPQPYSKLPLHARYAAYLLSVVKWNDDSSKYEDRVELVKKDGFTVDLNGNTISCCVKGQKICIASRLLLSEEEITNLKVKCCLDVAYSMQHADMYFYEGMHRE